MPKVEELLRREQKCFQDRKYPPIVPSECQGLVLRDIDGRSYLDFRCGTILPLGHRNQRVISAFTQQMSRIDYLGLGFYLQEVVVKHAEKLKSIAPGRLKQGKVAYCCSGTEAVEYGIKLARCYTRKPVIISYLWAHHGWGPAALSFTSDRAVSKLDYPGAVSNTVYVPYPYCYRCIFDQEYPRCGLLCLKYIESVLDLVVPSENVAGILTESIQGYNGYVVPPSDYMSKLGELCRRHELLFLDDEVLLNMGSTGKMFGVEHFDVEPDIMIMGKALGFGFPLAAIMADKEMIDGWKSYAIGGQLTSLGGHQAICAASLEGIEEIQSQQLLRRAEELGAYFLRRLEEMAPKHGLIGDVRGKGLCLGIEVVKNKDTKEPGGQEALEVAREASKMGLLILRVGSYYNVIRMEPPLTAEREMIDQAVEILDASFKKVQHQG